MNEEITPEQEAEYAQEFAKTRLEALKNRIEQKGKEQAMDYVKKTVFKRIIYWVAGIIGGFFAATWWLWLIFIVVIVILVLAKEFPSLFLEFFGGTPVKIIYDLSDVASKAVQSITQ